MKKFKYNKTDRTRILQDWGEEMKYAIEKLRQELL